MRYTLKKSVLGIPKGSIFEISKNEKQYLFDLHGVVNEDTIILPAEVVENNFELFVKESHGQD